MTIKEHIDKPLHKIKLVFVGNARNNMRDSLMVGCTKLGTNFVGLAPKSLFHNPKIVKEMEVTDEVFQSKHSIIGISE